MPKIMFVLNQLRKPKILGVWYSDGEHTEVTDDDIEEIENGEFFSTPQQDFAVCVARLKWVDEVSNNPEYTPDGYWDVDMESVIETQALDLDELRRV